MAMINVNNALLLISALAVVVFVHSISTWVRHRRFYKNLVRILHTYTARNTFHIRLTQANTTKPTPPHSVWTGNILSFVAAQRKLPPGTHAQVVVFELAKQHKLGALFYVDLFPVAPSLLVIHDPVLAAEVIQERQLERHPYVMSLVRALVGSRSVTYAVGPRWKTLRAMLSPGFTRSQLRGMTGEMVEAVCALRERLAGFAESGAVFPMLEVGAAVTADVIGVVVLGRSFECQRRYSPIVHYFRRAIGVHTAVLNVFAESRDWFAKKWYAWQLDREIGRAVEERYERTRNGVDQGKFVAVDLALDVYKNDEVSAKRGHPKLDREFKRLAVDNVKSLLIGGHDNSSVTLAYTIHTLSKHPNILDQVRKEHDSVFHPDTAKTIQLLRSEPQRLKQLPLTTACIKETLRLFPTGNIPRVAPYGTYIKHTDGVSYPLWNHLVWVSQYGIHRREDIWPNASKFDPRRFLAPSQVSKDAWRPFERGPRNCIGLELAMMELEMILLMVLRDFDFQTMYGADAPIGPEEHGGVVCPILEFAPKPRAGMPMRVTRRPS